MYCSWSTNAFILGSTSTTNRAAFHVQRCASGIRSMTPLLMSSSNSLEEPATADDVTTTSSSSSSSAITNDELTSTTEEQKEEDVKIYIGNISYSESKANIRKLFQTYGEVTDVFLPLNRETREGRGFGFVAMKDRAAAEKAVQELNQTTFGERTIYVNMAGEQRQQQQERTSKRSSPSKKYIKLYVGNISFDSTEEELKELFQSYGTVYDCFLPTWPDTGNLRGFAFISMDPEEAELAITNMDGTEFNGRVISVSKAMARKEKLERMSGGINGSTARKEFMKLYVGNISFDSTEDSIRQMFEQYGEVTNVYVPMDYDYDRNRGFAFVTMAGAAAADQAIREADGAELDGRTLKVNLANKSSDRRSASSEDWASAVDQEEGTLSSSSWEEENI